MIIKLLITVCAVAGAFALMAGYWPGAFNPISVGWVVPNTSYSPPWAHVVLLGVLLSCMQLKNKK